MTLNRLSSPEEKREASDTIFENLTDYFFNKVVFLNLIYSDFGDGGTYGGIKGTTSTTNLETGSRIPDTAEGKMMAPDREARMRCTFYLRSPSKLLGYILSPALLDSDFLGTVTSLDKLRAYVGLKFVGGEAFVVVKQAGGGEELFPTNFPIEMSDATFSKTFSLEVRYHIRSTEIYLNGQYIGTYTTDLLGSLPTPISFYPFLSPGKSTDGTRVNIAVEHLQYIQSI